MTVLRPEDWVAIGDLLTRCASSLDAADVSGFVDCFTEDGELVEDGGAAPSRARGVSALVDVVRRRAADAAARGRQQHLGPRRIELDPEGRPDHWLVHTYVLITDAHAVSAERVAWLGRHGDVVCKVEGAWLIRSRRVSVWDGELRDQDPGAISGLMDGATGPLDCPTTLYRII